MICNFILCNNLSQKINLDEGQYAILHDIVIYHKKIDRNKGRYTIFYDNNLSKIIILCGWSAILY